MSLNSSQVSYVTITATAGAGQRIDNYLVKKLSNIPKSKVYSILRKGEVRVNKGRIKPSYKLQLNDVVRIPPLHRDETPAPIIPQSAIERINLEQAVLYEDQNLIIINKPAGLAVHGGSGLSFGLIEMLRAQRPEAELLELVHRLDRDTSGCVIIAKNQMILRGMHALFRNRQINKIYHTLVKGFANDQFTVQEPLQRYVLASGERLVNAHPDGSPAETHFTTLKRFEGLTLLQAEPVTGRTHQIRVHAAIRGLPIIGDQKYGDKAYNKHMAKLGLHRLFLHAYELEFICPVQGIELNIKAPYDQEWIDALHALE